MLNKWVFVISFLLAVLGAIVNNLATAEPLDWIGSPEIIEVPEGY